MTTEEALRGAHLIGIGEPGMGGIARILLARGGEVSGSDAKESRTVLALRAQGARIAVGQQASNLDLIEGGPRVVVVSGAIRDGNPELIAARQRGITVLRRAQALAALMSGHRVACIAGSHGKTSTTSMLTVALQHCRLDPSFAIGGQLNESGANAHHGSGELFVAEVEETDGSFLVFAPRVAVVTNIDPRYVHHPGQSNEEYVAQFDRFVQGIQPDGVLVACADDPGAAALADRAESIGIRVRRYGFAATGSADAILSEFRPTRGAGDDQTGSVCDVTVEGRKVPLRLAVPGRHMAVNAAGALLASLELNAPLDVAAEGLATFGGVRRRFEFKGRAGRIRVYDDYAHSPTAVATQLTATRIVAGRGRIVVIFQPYLYSRTRQFAAAFGRSLSLADEVVVLDVYGAFEEPIPGVTGRIVADAVDLPAERVHYEPAFDRVPELVAGIARNGDVVLTMGAGDVTMLGDELIGALDRRQVAGPAG